MPSALTALHSISRACLTPAYWASASRPTSEVLPRSMSLTEHGQYLFRSAVDVVLPAQMLRRALELRTDGGPQLIVRGQAFPAQRNLYLVGFGKAVLGMAAAAEEILGDHLLRGIVSVPLGIRASLQQAGMQEMLLKPHSRIQVIEGAKHNLPDREALRAAGAICELAEGLTADDLLLVLISDPWACPVSQSWEMFCFLGMVGAPCLKLGTQVGEAMLQSALTAGGGSALLPAPKPPVLLEEKEKVTKLLASRGATIQELNIIRKALSLLKGGGLAQAAYPAQVLSLILSDVIGDPVDIIASGPTVANSHSTKDCFEILAKYNLLSSLPKSVETVLHSPSSDSVRSQDYSHVCNVIIGSNSLALEEAKHQAEALGYLTLILSAAVCGEVNRVAKLYGLLIQFVCLSMAGPGVDSLIDKVRSDLLQLAAELDIPSLNLTEFLRTLQAFGPERPVCLLAGGETTVQVQGSGQGGRNQELALRVGLELHKAKSTRAGGILDGWEVMFLSGGTDGQDGPTEAAGAFSSLELVDRAGQEGLEVEAFLSNNDSYTFFSKFQNGCHLLMTGLTGTNVMDIQAVLIRARDR